MSGGRLLAARRRAPRSHALIPLAGAELARGGFLIVTGLIGANVGLLLWPAAALHLILAVLLTRAWMEAARGGMTKRREAEGFGKIPRAARQVERPGRVGKEYEMKKAMLFGFVAALSTVGAAKADPGRSFGLCRRRTVSST